MEPEPIIDYLQRHLKAAGPRRFTAIAQMTGVAPSLLPKLAYGMRDNPRVQTVQPLIDFFAKVDRGMPLPDPQVEEQHAAE